MSKTKIVKAVNEATDLPDEALWAIEEMDVGNKLRKGYIRDLLIRLVTENGQMGEKAVDTILERMVAASYISEDRAAAVQETLMGMNSPKTRLEMLKWMKDQFLPELIAETRIEIALNHEALEALEEAEAYE